MEKRIQKRIVTKVRKVMLTSMAVLLLSTQPLTAFAYTKIYETASEVEYYADGVTLQNKKVYTNEGWINMNIVRVDLEKNIEMTVLTDTILSKRDTLTNIVKKNNADKTVAVAINSDFFDTANNTTMGNLVRNNEILTTSAGYNEFASFNMGIDGMPFIAYINKPDNIFTNGVSSKRLSYMNKPYLSYDRTIYFDNKYTKRSYGKNLGSDILEMLVVDNTIIEIRRMGEPFDIPANGYVIASVGKDIAEMEQNFHVGEIVNIDWDVNYRYTDLSIGGGAQIIKEGKVVTNFSHNITGVHPRTGLGITQDRKELIMVTIDGRTASYRGVTQTELANILIELGAYEGINFDGGGSTQMVAQSPFTNQIQTVNRPSDGAERRMYTSLAVKKVMTDSPTLRTIKISMPSDTVMLGAESKISLLGSDSNYNSVSILNENVVWSVEGITGEFANGKFNPTSLGKGTIKATYGGMTVSQPVTVKNNAVRLIATPNVITSGTLEERDITFTVVTDEGKTVPISSKVVKAIVPTTLGTFNYEKSAFVAGAAQGQGYISCEFDGLKTYIPVGVGLDKKMLYDFETPTASYSGYPSTVIGSYLETKDDAKQGVSGILSYDFTSTTGTRAAYINFNTPSVLPFDAKGIGMWVNGDAGNDHWLRASVTDAKGISTNLTFATHVDWTGWKYVSADLPTDGLAPYKLDRIYLAETEATKLDSGYILVDNIEAITSPKIVVQTPVEVQKIKQMSDYKLNDELIQSPGNVMSVLYYDKLSQSLDAFMKSNSLNWMVNKGQYAYSNSYNAHVLKLNNNNGSIRKNDYKQWVNLLNFVKTTGNTKPVVIMMSDVYKFNDSLEQELFLTQIDALKEKGLDVALIFPTSNDFFSVSKLNGAYLVRVPKSGDTAKMLKMGISNNQILFQGQ